MIIESERGVLLGGQAWLVEEGRELAWAEKHVVRNKALKWVLGKYVEADNANSNGHIFDLDELRDAQQSVLHTPLNMLHRPHYIVGNYVAAELMYPADAPKAAGGPQNPYVEALAAFYRYYYPDEYAIVEKAHAEGALYFSMECVPETVRCVGVCQQEYAYDGRTSPSYCAHLNEPGARKRLGKPHFTGGALIVPPVQPGWKSADVTELSSLLEQRGKEAEMAYDQIKTELPHLAARQWELMVAQLVSYAFTDVEGGEWGIAYSTDDRKQLAKKGHALPDGSFPIASPQDLANAIHAFGRAKPEDRAKVMAHIKKRAAALNKSELLPNAWK